MPSRSSRVKPSTACCSLGWACRDSGSSAASTFIRNGSPSPNRLHTAVPSCPSGSVRTASSSDSPPSSVSRYAGSPGCAPNQSSASGCGVGLGLPVKSAIAVREPQAYVRSAPRRRFTRLSPNQSQVGGRHLQPNGQHGQLLLGTARPYRGLTDVGYVLRADDVDVVEPRDAGRHHGPLGVQRQGDGSGPLGQRPVEVVVVKQRGPAVGVGLRAEPG